MYMETSHTVEEIFSAEDDSDFELDSDALDSLNQEQNSNSEEINPAQRCTEAIIKEGLRNKIQRRRISQGQGELKVEFEPPKQYELTPEERRKIEKRKQRNRKSADVSRLKRKEKLENLMKDEESLVEENRNLKAEVDSLQNYKQAMEAALHSHLQSCNNTALSSEAMLETISVREDRTLNDSSEFLDSKRMINENGNNNMQINAARGDSTYLSSLSRLQKIAVLKVYLKENQSKPEVRKLIWKINDMAKTNHRLQTT